MTHDETLAIHLKPARHPRARARCTKQRGFTLFEVLVATVILVIGVLGAAGMTITALRNSHQSGLRSTAVALAYDLGEIMRAVPSNNSFFINASTAANSGALSAFCYDPVNGCFQSELARNDLAEWLRKVTDPRIFPGGNAVICRDSANAAGTPAAPNCDGLSTSPVVVKIWWTEKNSDGLVVSSARPNMTVPLRPL